MGKEFYHSVRDLKNNMKPYITFSVITIVISSILFVPLISYIINRLFITRDTSVMLNLEILKVVLSFQGILIFIGLSLVGFLFLFIVFGAQLIYSDTVINGQEATMSQSFLATLKAMPKLIRFELIYFVFFIFTVIPLIEYETNPVMRYFMEAPPTLLSVIDQMAWGKIAYNILLFIILYLALRTIFVFHGILLEQKSIRGSVKLSLKLTKGRTLIILLKLLFLNSVLFGTQLALYYMASQIPKILNFPVNYVVRQYTLTLAALGMLFYFIMIIPINLLFLTRRYHDLKKGLGMEKHDEIVLVQWKWLMELEKKIMKTMVSKKRNFGLFMLLSMGIAFSVGLKMNQDFLYKGRDILIAAHRGDEKIAPENTLAAINAAIKNGSDIVEIDLQMTKDGVIILHHDSSMIRTVGISDSVSDLSYDEIKDLDVGSHFNESFFMERIPTLEQVFILAGKEGNFLLDVKTNNDEDELTREILNVIKAYDMEERVLIQSFNYSFLRKVREKNQEIKLGQIMYAAFGRLEDLDVDFYTVRKSMLSKQLISRARKADKNIFVWVIEEEEELKNIMKYDIDGIITSNLKMTYGILRSESDFDENEIGAKNISFLME